MRREQETRVTAGPRSMVRHDGGELRDAPSGELVRDLISQSKRLMSETQRLMRAEVAQAKNDVREEVRTATRGGAMAGGAAVVGLVAVLVLAFFFVYLLATAMPLWAGALIVGVVLAITAAALGYVGAKRFKEAQAKSKETLQHFGKEEPQWMKETMQGSRSRTHGTA